MSKEPEGSESDRVALATAKEELAKLLDDYVDMESEFWRVQGELITANEELASYPHRRLKMYPLVIWQGRQPLNGGKGTLFRVVDRGPPRENRPDDVPYGVEQRLGMSMLKEETWGPVKDRLCREAMHALVHAYGLLLNVDPRKLNLDHPLFCELNLAVAEGREPRGCDCPK